MNWQPIETAPKDGSYIVVWPPTWNKGVSCAKWNSDRFSAKPRPYWQRLDAMQTTQSRLKTPTHWAPIPLPPDVPETDFGNMAGGE
jgi:hypothetical protein